MKAVVEEIIDKAVDNYKERDVIIWGGGSGLANTVEEELINRGIFVYGKIDSNSFMIDGEKIFSKSILKGAKDKFYVVIPIGIYPEIKEFLIDEDYIPVKDFYYFCDCIITDTDDYYEDAHGNRIIGQHKEAEFVFTGYNSVIDIQQGAVVKGKYNVGSNGKLSIGTNSHFEANTLLGDSAIVNIGDHSIVRVIKERLSLFVSAKLSVCNNSIFIIDEGRVAGEVSIGEECNINVKRYIRVDLEGKVKIGNGCKMADVQRVSCGKAGKIVFHGNTIVDFNMDISAQSNSLLEIGEKCSIGSNFRALAPVGTQLTMGDGTLLSWNITIISSDAHSIFDINSGKRINKESKSTIIGEHVWIGCYCTILAGSEVSDGCIIGANSLVKGYHPNNCLIAGNPARIIRKDIAWNREITDVFMECDVQYYNRTEEC